MTAEIEADQLTAGTNVKKGEVEVGLKEVGVALLEISNSQKEVLAERVRRGMEVKGTMSNLATRQGVSQWINPKVKLKVDLGADHTAEANPKVATVTMRNLVVVALMSGREVGVQSQPGHHLRDEG